MSMPTREDATERDQLLPAAVAGISPQQRSAEHAEANGADAASSGNLERWYNGGLVSKLGASMFDFFTTGCAMSAVGALIPNIERRYDTSDGITAFIFPAGMIGYVAATASVETICLRHGRRGVAIATPVLRLLSALILATEPSFSIMLIAYGGLGFAGGLTDPAWNTWASGMPRPNVMQGLLHGSFSLGCICGPIISTAILRHHTWNMLYLVLALFSCIELVVQGAAFRRENAKYYRESQPTRTADDDESTTSKSLLQQPAIWICGAFYFVYMAVEATFTGWIVVFMLRARQADPTIAGLASSTFWVGMTVGRYALGLVTERFGVSMSVATYIALALCFQLVLNLVSDVNATMLLLAINGFLLAPLFPSGIVLLVARLQPSSAMRAVALLVALGQVGGALSELAVGFMADSLGIRHLFEVLCGLSAVMLGLWLVFARSG